MMQMRRLQPAHPRFARRMRILQVVDFVIGGDRRRVAHEFVGDPAQLVDLGRREHVWHDDKAVALIGGALRIDKHGAVSPYFFGARPARAARTACTAATSSSAWPCASASS